MKNTLQEFIEDIYNPKTQPQDEIPINGEVLEVIKDKLLKFKEFEGVEKINILPMPIFLGDKETEKPILNDENYLGEETKTIKVSSYKLRDNESNFSKEIDIYSIHLTPPMYDTKSKDMEVGVWKYPTIYDGKFTPINKIVVNWCPERILNSFSERISSEELDAKIKKRIMKQFEEALDSNKSNIPTKRGVIVRISPRRIKGEN